MARPPLRALDETAARLNARPALVAQRALADRLSDGPPVQLGRKKNKKRKPIKRKTTENKKRKLVLEEDEKPTEVGEHSEESRSDQSVEEEERDRVPSHGKRESNSGNSSSDEEEERKDEKEEIEEKKDEESDSEDEAVKTGHKPAKKHRGLVVNYTKFKPTGEKVANKVEHGSVGAATGRLMADAKAIHKVLPEKAKGPTTITTALLLHKPTQLYKRFAFCNLALMPLNCRTVAEQRGYHVVKAPETHAEGQLIEYLYVRGPIYEHHNMGVDKDHCAECQILMESYFGKEDYSTKAGKSDDVYNKYKSPSLLREAVGVEKFGPITKFRDKDGGKIKEK